MVGFDTLMFCFYVWDLAPRLYVIPQVSNSVDDTSKVKHKSLVFKATTDYNKNAFKESAFFEFIVFLIIFCLTFGTFLPFIPYMM